MTPELQRQMIAALERPHRLGMIGGDLEEQLAHCASFFSVLAEVCRVEQPSAAADLGTGGGVPGIALAAATPNWRWRLIEMRGGRANELDRVVARLGLAVTVDTRPAQDVAHDSGVRESFDLVTARAFGPPALVAECAGGLLRVGGWLIVSEPPEDQRGDRWPVEGMAACGFGPAVVREAGGSRFAVARKIEPTAERLPRRPPRSDRGWPERST